MTFLNLIKTLMEEKLEWNYVIKGEEFLCYCSFENQKYYDWIVILDLREKEIYNLNDLDTEYELGTKERRDFLIETIKESGFGKEKANIDKIYKKEEIFKLHRIIKGYLL